MRRRRTLALPLLALLSVVGISALAWCLLRWTASMRPHEIAESRDGHKKAREEHAAEKQPPTAAEPPTREIVPRLEPVGQKTKEPVDLDSFGDITQEYFFGQGDPYLVALEAKKAGKSEREIGEIIQQSSRKALEYWQKKREALRQAPENKGKTDEQLDKEMRDRHELLTNIAMARTVQAARATFRLGGIVVDGDGQRLSDVEIDVRKESRNMFGWGNERNEMFSGTIRVAGSFALRIEDATEVSLTFRKLGYYPVREDFAVSLPGRCDSPEILANKKLPPKTIERQNLRIVMEKQGKLTLLRSGGGTLAFRHDGNGDVLEMGVDAGGHWFMRGTRRTDISIRPPKHLPEKCVYIVPKSDDKGRIVLTKLSALQARRAKEANRGGAKLLGVIPDDESQYVYVPTELRLVVSDPQGGFVRHEFKPGHEIRPDRPWTRDMKEAPQEGYVRELLLNSETIKKLFADPDEPQPVYFYIKAFGKYGKGQLSNLRIMLKEAQQKYVNGQLEPIHYLLDEAGLAAQILILIQPDGSRNLEGYE